MKSEVYSSACVTVLLSTFNGSRYLQAQLDSIYEQTFSNLRILVRDDGSSDSTLELLEKEKTKGKIVLLEGNRNLGPAQSFLMLLKTASSTDTEFVAFCDQDDVWHPEKITHAVRKLDGITANKPAMYCSRLELVDESLNHIGYTDMPKKVGFGNALVESIAVGCTIVLNREAMNMAIQAVSKRVVMHDWWCYLVISCFGVVVFDEEATLKYRQHGSNVIGATKGFARLVKKYLRFFGDGGGYSWMSMQATALLEIFNESVPESNRKILRNFIEAKTSWYRRLQLSLTRRIWRQKLSDNLLLRLLILLNRF